MAKCKVTDAEIKNYCVERGLSFKPWEQVPWLVDDGPCPWAQGCSAAKTWPKAQKLRQEIITVLTGRRG